MRLMHLTQTLRTPPPPRNPSARQPSQFVAGQLRSEAKSRGFSSTDQRINASTHQRINQDLESQFLLEFLNFETQKSTI